MKKKILISKKNVNPFFSVITVVKNSENLISKTITSIKKQSFKNFEYIIINGGSKDNTLKKILAERKIINYLVSEKDKGIYYAMNKALKLSNGNIVVFVNAGDLLTKDALKIISKKFTNYLKFDFVFGTVKRHYTTNTIIKSGFNINRIKYNFDFATSHSTGFFIKRKTIKKLGYFDTRYKCSADYDLYYKAIIKKKLNGTHTPKNQLIGIVQSGGYSSKISFFEHLFEEIKIRFNNKQNFFFILFIFCNAIIKQLLKKII